MKKLTTKDWTKKVKEIHGNKYSYSKVQYINAKTKVIIICPIHGDFEQTPDHHQRGRGCPKCALEYKSKLFRSNTQEFITKAQKIHGDKYDYSQVDYIKASEKVKIICPKHGVFLQTPNEHLSGYGCIKCAHDKLHTERVKDISVFVEQANKVHNQKYSYSKVQYLNAHTKVCIVCPEHGEFWQTPHDHLNGKCGCPSCNLSKGEREVAKYLKERGIEFISQYEIPIDSRINSSGKAYIDFYLPRYNTFIEFNGVQHYIPIEYFGGKLKYENYQIPRDNYIENYCQNNHISLIKISYTDDVNNVLQSKLKI